jgi:hypothetical protein
LLLVSTDILLTVLLEITLLFVVSHCMSPLCG